jgi:hypothetical protein
VAAVPVNEQTILWINPYKGFGVHASHEQILVRIADNNSFSPPFGRTKGVLEAGGDKHDERLHERDAVIQRGSQVQRDRKKFCNLSASRDVRSDLSSVAEMTAPGPNP